MEVLQLIDTLHDLVRDAKHVPLRGEVRVHQEKLDGLLDQLRATIPEEIKAARSIVKERGEILAAAEQEAERILAEARESQTELVAEHHLIGQAELASEAIIDEARAEELEIRLGAEDYADEILSTFELNLSKFIAAIQRGRERLGRSDEPAADE
jgi:cell division septum initiation protein DivIVA